MEICNGPNTCEIDCNSLEIMEPSNLTTINDDCKMQIFKYLDYIDLISIAETSKQLHTAAHNVFKQKYGNGKVTIRARRTAPR